MLHAIFVDPFVMIAEAPLFFVEVLIGGKLNRFIPNPTFDPVIVPGCLDLQFRGQIPEGVDPRDPAVTRAAAPPRPRTPSEAGTEESPGPAATSSLRNFPASNLPGFPAVWDQRTYAGIM